MAKTMHENAVHTAKAKGLCVCSCYHKPQKALHVNMLPKAIMGFACEHVTKSRNVVSLKNAFIKELPLLPQKSLHK